jgi:hypothetical protein
MVPIVPLRALERDCLTLRTRAVWRTAMHVFAVVQSCLGPADGKAKRWTFKRYACAVLHAGVIAV